MIMKRKIDIPFEFKVMGINAYIPLIGALFVAIYSAVSLKSQEGWMNTVSILEIVMPFLSGWYSVFLFQDVLEEIGSETIFTYPIKRYELGVLRVLVFFIFYMVILALVLLEIQLMVDKEVFLTLFLQLSLQGLFFSSLGFVLVTITSSSIWSLTVLSIYSVTQIITGGNLFSFINVYLFNGDIIPINEIFIRLGHVVILSLLFLSIGHVLFSKYKNFK